VKYYTNKTRQAGMTLIELTVVLLVLIGLAGLMIPYVGGFVEKTHDSTGASNLKALNEGVGRFEAQFMRYPDGMDSLLTTSGGVALNTFMVSNATNAGMNATALSDSYGMTPLVTLAATVVNDQAGAAVSGTGEGVCWSLNKRGINNTILNVADGVAGANGTVNATFDNAAGASGLATKLDLVCTTMGGGTLGGAVMQVNSDNVAHALALNTADTDGKTYVAFGVGTYSEMNGRTMQDSPVHFASRGDMAATEKYNRLVAIFEVDPTATMTTGNSARFVGSAMVMMSLEGLGGALTRHYEKVNNN